MTDTLLLAFWFFVPAAAANSIPVVASKVDPLKKWKTPMDFNKQWRGQPVLGANKTWRGLFIGVGLACIIAALQYNIWLPPEFADKSLGFMVFLGGVMGLGALVGDALESFFKRRINRAAGQSWFPFDQIDYVLGGILFTLPFVRLSLITYVWIIILYFAIHVSSVYFFYKIGVRDRPI